jgi:hypothetical protein
MTQEGSSEDDVRVMEAAGRNKVVEVIKVTIGPKLQSGRRGRMTKEALKPEELLTIRTAMAESGDRLDLAGLAKQLGRNQSTIRERVKQIKRTGGVATVKKHLALEEDLLIVDRVLERLQGRRLADKMLLERDWQELGHQLNRSSVYTRQRWETILQPWLLQHAAGTLNLRVEQMLVGHIAGRYTDRSDIHWDEVVAKFAGHTVHSVKRLFKNLETNMCQKNGLQASEVTLELLLKYVESEYRGKQVSETKRERQRRVIDYFAGRVADLGISDYL